ncbi:MAG: TIM barrel protein [Acidobacteria bacterium]|nr:TIM barrel protein [Acidobacteriota bacterium]MBI3421793.1 TIM barrel protein [Acidobacteriota bacterium]
MLNRRSFLQTAAVGTLGAALTQRFANVASARKLSKIGVQLYTVRNEMAKDFEGTIAKVAALGYQQVEFAGYYNRTPEQVKAVLAKNKLEAPSVHVALKELRENLDKAVETAQAVGHKLVVCPFVMPEERKTLADFKAHAAVLNKAATAFKKVGIEFGYHNHDFEFMPIEGQLPMDLLLAETDPKLVKFELDLFWIIKAKHDPLAFFAKNPGRVIAYHVKDMAKDKEVFTEVGQGRIDFKPLLAKANQAGAKYFFVEQDQCPGPPLDSLKISFDYLKNLNF